MLRRGHRRIPRVVPAIVLGLLAVLASADPASAQVSIGRARTDGTALEYSFIANAGPFTESPEDIAVGGGHLYWLDGNGIARANLDGSGVDFDFITGLGEIRGLTVGGGYLFWGGASIGRARLDGTEVNPGLMTPGGRVADVAATDQYLYWTSDVGIGRAGLDGANADPGFIETSPGDGSYYASPFRLAVNRTQAFWVDFASGNRIARANLDGSGVEPLTSSDCALHGDCYLDLAADDRSVFVSVGFGLGSPGEQEIRRFGSNAAPGSVFGCCSSSWWAPTSDPFGESDGADLASDGKHVYWTHSADRQLYCTPRLELTDQSQRGREIRFTTYWAPCERVDVVASGHIEIGPDRYEIKRKTATIGPADDAFGQTPARLVVRPRHRDHDPILAALKRGQPAYGHLKLRISDQAGNSQIEWIDVRLKRHRG